ncbi:hypothetical protein BJ138DRAFT_1112303 [Hygrophoropsis aurantiaca]|uniref:Uncharacterized protein n=1 Tax=Hygrophoropsis aurantiaca TaxID=72124 RepID=A0ACB8AGP0_9AGAM|nr:hypothetical protein BJ138DRAFT_1112303 [Hygrophoropsis aurantiaca]
MKKRKGGRDIGQTNSKDKNHKTPSPINLPAEILLIIFNFAYEQCRAPISSTSPNHTTQWLNTDPLSLSFFPHSIASVSSFWRDVMYMEPKFWTRFVVFVGRTALDDAQAYLDWTKDQPEPLDIFIISKCNGEISPLHERSLVESCMQLLSPHFHQCRTIRISVTLRSSLPRLDHHFCDSAPDLTDLRIDCEINNAVPDSWPNDIAEWSFSSKGLRKLHLDSIYIREAWLRGSSWLRGLCLRKLTISSGSPSDGKHSTSDQTMLSHIQAVTRGPGLYHPSFLTIKGVSIKYEDPLGLPAHGITLTLDGMTQSSVMKIINAYQPLYLRLCNLAPSFDFSIFMGPNIYHCNRTHSIATHNNCLSFTDEGIIWKFHYQLRYLTIIDCAKVTPTVLKSLVDNVYQTRDGATSKQRMRGWPSERHVNPLHTLMVVGGAQICAADQRWFESRVLNFDWQATTGKHKPSKYIDSVGE